MLDVKIDALLMDYALGAASEEVGVLVEAYVERDEGARARLEELRGMVGMAKRVMGSDVPSGKHAQGPYPGHGTRLPAFPRRAMERALWRRRVLIAGAMAACVAVGVTVGWLWTAGRSGREVIVQVEERGVERQAPVEVAAVRDFWSVERLRATVQEARSDGRDVGADRQRELALRHFFGGGL